MKAADLIAAIRALGTTLEPVGVRVRWHGPMTDWLRDALAAEKAQVLALLRAEAGLCSDCGESLGLDGAAVRLALVAEDGTQTCIDCLLGYSQLRRAGVPC